MAIIELRGLSKSYRVYQKAEGLAASIRGLFRREYRGVQAVRGVDLDVEQGEFVADCLQGRIMIAHGHRVSPVPGAGAELVGNH